MWPVSPRNSWRVRRSRIRMSGLSRRTSNATGGVILRNGGRSRLRKARQPVSRTKLNTRLSRSRANALRMFMIGHSLHLLEIHVGHDLADLEPAGVEDLQRIVVRQLLELGAGERAELPQDVEHHAVAAALAPVRDLDCDPQGHRTAHRQA